MTLVTSLIDIAKMAQMDLENTERQLETELKKGQAKRAFAKVESMKRPNQEILAPDWLITSHVTQITSSDWQFT